MTPFVGTPMSLAHHEVLRIKVVDMERTEFDNIRFVELTDQIAAIVARSNVRSGIVTIQTMHTTTFIRRLFGFRGPFSRLAVNEDEKGLVRHDVPYSLRFFLRLLKPFVRWLEANDSWHHDKPERLASLPNEPRNAASHLINFLIGRVSETMIVRDGKLRLGTWQKVVFFDCDPLGRIQQGVESRTLEVQVLGIP